MTLARPINDAATYEFLGQLSAQHAGAPVSHSANTRRRDNFFQPFAQGGQQNGFAGAKFDRLTEDWNPGTIAPNALHRMDGRVLRERARDLAINNPFAKAGISAYVANTIECGILPKPTFDEPDRRKLWIKAWNHFGADEADITGQQHVYEMMGLWLAEVLIAGGCLMHFVDLPPSRERRLPLAVELIPEERFADDRDTYILWNNKRKSKNPIIRGVEIESSTGRPLAYWIQPAMPNDVGPELGDPISVPAADCQYAFFKNRIGQYRGHTLLHAAIMWLWKLGYYTDNELMASAIKSCYSAFVAMDGDGEWPGLKDADPDSSLTDIHGNPVEKLQPGLVIRGRPGESITGVGPNTPTGDQEAWIVFIERAIAVALDLSYEELCRDYSRGNFSSTRAGANADRKRFRPMQKFTVNHFGMPLWKRFAMAAARRGLDGFPRPAEFLAEADDWLQCNWRAPGWASVNPFDDARADDIRVKNRTRTRERIIGDEGGDWEEDFEQMDREEQKLDDLELSRDSSAAAEAAELESAETKDEQSTPQKPAKKKPAAEHDDAMYRAWMSEPSIESRT